MMMRKLTVLVLLVPCCLYATAFVIPGAKGSASDSASTTTYGCFLNGLGKGTDTFTTEASAQTVFRTAGSLSKLTSYWISYDRASGTVKSRVAGADGNQTMSITGSGQFSDATNTDSVTAGTKYNFQVVTGSGGTTSAFAHSEVVFTPTTATTVLAKLGGSGATNYASNSTTWFMPPSALPQSNSAATEGQYKYTAKTAGTWRNLAVYVSANGRSSAGTFRSRKNTANGGQSASITASTTGLFEDTSGSDSIAVADLMSHSFTTGTGSGTTTIDQYDTEFQSSGNGLPLISSTGVNNGQSQSTSLTRYISPGTLQVSSTENDYKVDLNGTITASNMQVNVLSNSLTNTATFTSRKNAAAGGQSISVTSGTTGLQEDSSGTDSLVSGDYFNYRLVTVAGGTSIGYTMLSVLATLPAPAGGTTFRPRRIGQ